jgi:hypothetical protein
MNEVCGTGRRSDEWKGYPDFQHQQKSCYKGLYLEMFHQHFLLKGSFKINLNEKAQNYYWKV